MIIIGSGKKLKCREKYAEHECLKILLKIFLNLKIFNFKLLVFFHSNLNPFGFKYCNLP
jgi:hypothetical protein